MICAKVPELPLVDNFSEGYEGLLKPFLLI